MGDSIVANGGASRGDRRGWNGGQQLIADGGLLDSRWRTGMDLYPHEVNELDSDTELDNDEGGHAHDKIESEFITTSPKTPPLRRTISNPRPYLITPQTSPERHRRNRSTDVFESPGTPPTLLKLKAKIPSLRRREKGKGLSVIKAPPRPERPDSLRLEEPLSTTKVGAGTEGVMERGAPSAQTLPSQKTRNQRPAPLDLDQPRLRNVKRPSLTSPLTPGSALIPIANDPALRRPSDSLPNRWDDQRIHLDWASPGPLRLPSNHPANNKQVYHIPTILSSGQTLPRVCDIPSSKPSPSQDVKPIHSQPTGSRSGSTTFHVWKTQAKSSPSSSSPDSGISTGDTSSNHSSNNITGCIKINNQDPATWPPSMFVDALNEYFSTSNDNNNNNNNNNYHAVGLVAAPFVDMAGDGQWYLYVPRTRSETAVAFGRPVALRKWLGGGKGRWEKGGGER